VERTDISELIVESPKYDIAKLNWTLFNQDSELRELERNQGFSILYVQTDDDNLRVGTNNFLKVPNESSIAPGFISPDVNIPKNLQDRMNQIVEKIFRIAEQNGIIAVQDEKSGIAKEWDFVAYSFVLRNTKEMVREAELWMARMFQLYTREAFDYDPQYPDDFQPRAAQVQLEAIERVVDLGLGPKGLALAKKRAVQTVFHDSTTEELEPIMAEIDEGQSSETQILGQRGAPRPRDGDGE